MAWTAPRTWVTGETPSAAIFNTHVRDNLLETAPGVVSAANQLVYADGANSIAALAAPTGTTGLVLVNTGSVPVWREIGNVHYSGVNLTETSTSFSDLTTAVEILSLTTGTRALVLLKARIGSQNSQSLTFVGFRISGDTTLVAAEARCLMMESSNTGIYYQYAMHYYAPLTAGDNSFHVQMKTQSGGTAFCDDVSLTVIPMN